MKDILLIPKTIRNTTGKSWEKKEKEYVHEPSLSEEVWNRGLQDYAAYLDRKVKEELKKK
jgi:hypothetical protein